MRKYKHMRKYCSRAVLIFILACCILPCVTSQELPRPVGYVNDFAGVMTSADKRAVDELAVALKAKTGAEIAVVTVKSFAPYATIEDFSIALAQSWGVGEKGKDTGVLLILAMAERDVRIEVGYGLEGAIPDSVAGRILDTAVIPAFRKDDFSGGLAEGSRAIAAYVLKEKGVTLDGYDIPEAAETAHSPSFFSIILVLFFLVWGTVFFSPLLIMIGLFKKYGRGKSGSFGSGGSFGRSLGGFSSSRSSFSSSRSFGGGSFGGGGASRRF